MNKPKKIITLEPDVVRFLQEHAKIETVCDENSYKIFTLPNWKLKHRELNDFELVENKERYFFISYNGLNPLDGKGIMGHLAFNSVDYPSLLFMTEQLIPERSKFKITDVVITLLHEFKSEADFDEFTIGRNMGEQLDDIISQN